MQFLEDSSCLGLLTSSATTNMIGGDSSEKNDEVVRGEVRTGLRGIEQTDKHGIGAKHSSRFGLGGI